MKLNITTAKMKGKMTWYSFDEKCDRCGSVYLTGVHTTKKPNSDELDFCIECYKFLFDNDIPYSEAMKMFKK